MIRGLVNNVVDSLCKTVVTGQFEVLHNMGLEGLRRMMTDRSVDSVSPGSRV